MTFDLSSITTEASAEFQYRHPQSGELLPLWITLCSSEHPTRQQRVMKTTRDARVRIKKAGGNAGAAFDIDPVESENQFRELIAACTLSWRSESGDTWAFDGAPLKCTPENVLMVLNTPKLKWLREQTKEFFSDDAGFTQGSPKPSTTTAGPSSS